jgi:hypothetical protein
MYSSRCLKETCSRMWWDWLRCIAIGVSSGDLWVFCRQLGVLAFDRVLIGCRVWWLSSMGSKQDGYVLIGFLYWIRYADCLRHLCCWVLWIWIEDQEHLSDLISRSNNYVVIYVFWDFTYSHLFNPNKGILQDFRYFVKLHFERQCVIISTRGLSIELG